MVLRSSQCRGHWNLETLECMERGKLEHQDITQVEQGEKVSRVKTQHHISDL